MKRTLRWTFPLLMLLLMAPLCARAEDEGIALDEADPGTIHAALSYGPATVDDLYGERWEGENFRLSYTYFEGYYGLGVGMHFLNLSTDTRRMEGYYSNHGAEAMFYLTPGVRRVLPYAGVGLGAHYNFIDVEGKKNFTSTDGYGFRAIGEAGLRVMPLDINVFGSPSRLMLGAYWRYSANREYFFDDFSGTKTADFHAEQYGLEFGVHVGL